MEGGRQLGLAVEVGQARPTALHREHPDRALLDAPVAGGQAQPEPGAGGPGLAQQGQDVDRVGRRRRPGAALLAAALGAGGVLLAERYLKDRQAAPRTEAVDLPADDPISLAEAALAQAAAHDAPEVNFEAADSPRASSASDIDETEAATPAA